jgi:putative tryptophan/tyrosine transport system substrate-binding protein
MKRRQFIALLGGAVSVWPHAARAQQQAMPVVGFLGNGSPNLWADRVRAFRQGLSEAGYVEGQNVAIEYRWAFYQNDRLPALATDLIRRQIAVIIAPGPPAALAAKAATTTIPIVFSMMGDPVEFGLVASLNRPGDNLTGVSGLGVELGPKQLELLRELIPTATIIALLVNPTSPNLAESTTKGIQVAARALGLQVHVLHASTERDFDLVFAALAQLRARGLVIGADSLFNSLPDQLVALAARHAVPTIYQFREFVEAGGLMSYGPSLTDSLRLVGVYAGRILKGTTPADLPVIQPTKFEFVVNLKTARSLRLEIPPKLLAFADEVIE